MKLSEACDEQQQPKAENKIRAVCDTLQVPVQSLCLLDWHEHIKWFPGATFLIQNRAVETVSFVAG